MIPGSRFPVPGTEVPGYFRAAPCGALILKTAVRIKTYTAKTLRKSKGMNKNLGDQWSHQTGEY
jgi:hypothetical protein